MGEPNKGVKPELLLGLEWQAPSGPPGHLLVERILETYGKDERSPELMLSWPWPEVESWPKHDPMGEPALFRIFADTDPTPEGCLAFADRYGSLGDSAQHGARSRPRGEMQGAEPVRVWTAAIHWLRHLIRLWEAARSNDAGQLAGLVQWQGDYIIRLLGLPSVWSDLPRAQEFRSKPARHTHVLAPGEIRPYDFGLLTGDSLRPGDLAAPAMLFCAVAVNSAMEGLVEDRLVWDLPSKSPVRRLVPKDLWGAMLIQFMLAIDGDKNYRRCPVCRRWFELAPGLNRANKFFCSASCRTRATRQKMERALQLHSEGKSPREIAEDVGSEVKFVKSWIKASKKKEK